MSQQTTTMLRCASRRDLAALSGVRGNRNTGPFILVPGYLPSSRRQTFVFAIEGEQEVRVLRREPVSQAQLSLARAWVSPCGLAHGGVGYRVWGTARGEPQRPTEKRDLFRPAHAWSFIRQNRSTAAKFLESMMKFNGVCLGGPLAGRSVSGHSRTYSVAVHGPIPHAFYCGHRETTPCSIIKQYQFFETAQLDAAEYDPNRYNGLWIWCEHTEVPQGTVLTMAYAMKLLTDEYAELAARLRGLEK